MAKKILIGLGILVGVLAVALALLVAFLDVNQYKPQIEAAVKDKTKRTLKIDGDLKLSVFPRLALALPKTTLSNLASDRVSASVASARVSVALLPLLRKEIRVGHIAVDGLTTTIERRKDGSTNLDDLIKRDPTSASAQAASSDTVVQFEIGGIELTNANLTFDDRMTGNTTQLTQLFLKTGRLATKSQTPVELDVTFNNTKPSANGFLKAKGEINIDLVAQAFSVTGVTAEVKAALDNKPIDTMFKAERMAARAAGDAQALSIEGLDLSAKGTLAGLTIELSRIVAPKLEFDPATLSLAVSGLEIDAKGKRGADAFALSANAPKLSASRKDASGEKMVATMKVAGAQTIDARVELDGIGGTAQALTASKLALTIDAAAANAKKAARRVQAQLAGPVTANLEAQTFTLPALTGEVSIEDSTLPNNGMRLSLQASAKLNLKDQTLSSSLQSKFDETTATASIDIKDIGGDGSPRISFEASADKFNLDRYVPPSDPKAPPSSAGESADAKVDFSAVKDLRLNGALRVGQFQARNMKASNLRIALKAAGGKLEVAPLSASLYGGTVNANANVFSDNRVTVNATLANVMIEPLLKDAADKAVLSGRGNVKLDVRAAGGSVNALKRALDGSASLALKDGAVKGVNLGKIVREGRTKLGMAGATDSGRTTAGDQTDFSELTASFAINNGVATNTDLDGKSPLLRLGGEGKIDVAVGTLDYTARVSVVGTSQGQGGRELEQLRGLTIPVKLTGPFEAMSYSVDWSALARDALKSKIGEQVKDKLSPQVKEQRDKLKEQLKGLLRR